MSPIRSPSLSSLASVINAQSTTVPPVAYLKPYAEFGVLLCSEHRYYYTPRNYLEHLRRAYGVKGQLKRHV
jgi:hypothetical protein